MKRKNFAILLLCAPLALAAGCGGGIARVDFQTYWYRNTALGGDIAGTNETLEYAVTMSSSTPHNGLSAEYTDGVFTSSLINKAISLDSGSKEGYALETNYSAHVKFTYLGESSAVLEDTATSYVEFLSVQDSLKPVYSKKTVHCYAPNGSPNSLANAYTEYRYTIEVRYNDGLTEAKATYTNLIPDGDGNAREPETSSYELDAKKTYLDNEQIWFALRGMSFTGASSFQTLNTSTRRVIGVSLREAAKKVTEPVDFERNGESVKSEGLSAYEVKIGLDGNIGQGRTVVIAEKSSDNNNVNRNAVLRVDVPIMSSLGTLRYTLKKANFSDK